MSKVIILGSAFAVANRYQENAHLLIDSPKRTILIDCGNNPVGKLEQAGYGVNQITDLVLTHAHADHMGALPLLLMDMWLLKRKTVLDVYGLAVTLDAAKKLLDVFNWQKWAEMFPVNFHEVTAGAPVKFIQDEDLQVSAVQVQHLIPTIGVRADFAESGKSIVYSCDTEPCPSLDLLAEKADVLIQEAAGPGKGHTSPLEAGVTALKAGVTRLILIHYDAAKSQDEMIGQVKENFKGKIDFASDLMIIQ